MSAWAEAADLVGAVLLLLGCLQCLLGVIGMLRFPDVLSRSHAATKPQTLGMLLVLVGVAVRLRQGIDLGTLALIVFFQFLTSPVASHLVARSAYRTGQTGSRGLLRDDLDPQLSDGERQGE
ncbi:monovalent cation/H(+) antiporter subunit G [Streptomyces mutabilis]|uniref:monovalent cation/H(+) antiporter subunit G n=1 Tax=Streptomyces TaxID=1883 RepID=UPI000BD66F34|nr:MULTISPECIES: monovalent cation/H(+) antiporter subunit G [Streptomyces]MCZ9353870.1 monovalent cation/H(+) antiporter subunit G [Streptomyces mutabilis]MDN3250639.1 monovalent cation/H(+) antiporter subunit G [Streptomyces sp. ZSW22]MDN3257573.1 monovalent cation/H(+) antiporter subunit G [Streptomyces sp. MA25(2023)]MDQ0384076.1 multicomponent Na+:H+ antiporter subunit G [Streptomyces sp. DSM 42143]PAK23672.1 Na+/H+ antiporter subunit G [Streptomyces sp. alain-838]